MNNSAFTSIEDRETVSYEHEHEGKPATSWITFQTEIDLGMEQKIAQYIATRGGGYASIATTKLGVYRYAITAWGGPMFMLNGEKVPCLPDFVDKVRPKNPVMLLAKQRMDEIFFAPDAAATEESEPPTQADDLSDDAPVSPNEPGHPTA